MKRVIGAVITVCALASTAFAQDPLILRSAGSQIGVSIADAEAGVVVNNVNAGSPAERAGFRNGDVIIEFDGLRVRSAREFSRIVAETRPNRAVSAVVQRDGSRQTLSVTPETASAGTSSVRPFALERAVPEALRRFGDDLNLRVNPRTVVPRAFGEPAPQRLGIEVSPLSDQLAQYFGVKGGALVASVDAGTPAAQAGLRSGDVITAINGEAITAPADVSARVRGAAEGATLELKVMRDRKEVTLKAVLPSSSPRPGRI